MGKIKIQNETIEFKEREMKVDELLFWSENPRVHSELHAVDGVEPTQKEIEDILTSKDHVKQLRNSIKTNGGLTHPVFVRDGVVVEGNSRLAAYRLLCRNDKITWAKIRCNVLPPDMSDDLVFSFISPCVPTASNSSESVLCLWDVILPSYYSICPVDKKGTPGGNNMIIV